MKKQGNMVDIFDISESSVYGDRILEFKDLESSSERAKSYFRKITQKIEGLQTKAALSKIRQIIIEEERKSYYRNAIHVQEIIDINRHTDKDDCGRYYCHEENMVIWSNGYYSFHSFDYTISEINREQPNSHQEKLKKC